jgi:F-type H+-transporting ATPase subunit b
MDETLRQLGGLLLGSVPTIILFLVTFLSYRFIVHGKLEHVLKQRYLLTEGAIEKARADLAAAEAKASEYEQRLREAKVAIFKAQESRRQAALTARAALIAEGRDRAQKQVQQARERIAQEIEVAKKQLQPESERLANLVIRAILKSVAVAQPPAGGAQ